ncbi:hypothetical protein F4821DRAFT_263694 [Hypoxylon rubiginosum]|uniref:Uncharacterized protein n=1 Tax=Hypoxylon rubiginosum TaxID=110542 RepID=A0ACC0CQK4_9PEZI|nr:hypothetical protein F4821DRAFT_263694 [Hypoxylon rubiginosum]
MLCHRFQPDCWSNWLCRSRHCRDAWSALLPNLLGVGRRLFYYPQHPQLNTALWITNLSPTCTHRQLLNAIRGCGKVYTTVINPPEEDTSVVPYGMRPTHTMSASKLVFFDRQGVVWLVA